MSDNVRLWRWRRNPLRRRSDVAEAWAGLAVGTLIALGAPAAGVVTGVAVEQDMLRQSETRHRTPAVLAERAPSPEGGAEEDTKVLATVRWTASDGTPHTGKALVKPDSPAGARVSVWTDGDGRLRSAPATPGQALAGGVISGSAAAVVTGVLLAGGGRVIRAGLDAARATRWEREWAEIGPRWNQHTA
ncbi:hypothetical protein RKE29_11490 [Streptomyces sp. B1866]|uniref:Rv1733c family protein n=1 Tax=Streptomyces sp. B1866 TaxID=3075431 RepID=UPI002891A3A8|nr:hypothetical protein [Streptomyces sp. B1866]MDT3397261.1 hypothetical protein [Streptomyces sp. B1866]